MCSLKANCQAVKTRAGLSLMKPVLTGGSSYIVSLTEVSDLFALSLALA